MLKKFFILFAFVLVGITPKLSFASNIYIEPSRDIIHAGDTFIANIKIDTEGEKVNSVEGDVAINADNMVVNDFSLSNSIFTLWPRTPSLSKDGHLISFVGGVPGGFNSDKKTLFSIVIETKKEGDIKISPKNIAVYANDGKGTRVQVKVKDLIMKVLPKNESVASLNDWSQLVLSDKTKPEKFKIEIGKDPSLFDGNRFAFFTAVDKQSGVSFYEVSEDGRSPIRSGSTYVLQNQDENKAPKLVVTAYDKAGNKTTIKYQNPSFRLFGLSIGFYVLLLVIVMIWLFKNKILLKIKGKNV